MLEKCAEIRGFQRGTGIAEPAAMFFMERPPSLLLVVLALSVSATPARAQRTEVGGGVSWSWLQGDYGQWYTYQGWSLEAGRSITPHFSIIGRLNTDAYSDHFSNGSSDSYRNVALTGGPKLSTSPNGRVMAFAQLPVGIERRSYTLREVTVPDLHESSSGFGIEPGGGVDVKVVGPVAARAQLNAGVFEPWHPIFWRLARWQLAVGGVYKW